MENENFEKTRKSSFQSKEEIATQPFELMIEEWKPKGRAFFQFNDEEPRQLAELYNTNTLTIELGLPPEKKSNQTTNNNNCIPICDNQDNCITFYDNDNKNTFKLFVERIDNDNEGE